MEACLDFQVGVGEALDTEASAGSGASFLTDEGPSDQTQQIERSSKSLSSLKPVRSLPFLPHTSMRAGSEILHKCTSQHHSCRSPHMHLCWTVHLLFLPCSDTSRLSQTPSAHLCTVPFCAVLSGSATPCETPVLPRVSQDVPQMGGKQRHKRSQTVLDGSPPKALQPPSQPATPLRRALWGSRAAAAPAPDQEPAGPNPYTACDPFDVTMMRCASPSVCPFSLLMPSGRLRMAIKAVTVSRKHREDSSTIL